MDINMLLFGSQEDDDEEIMTAEPAVADESLTAEELAEIKAIIEKNENK